MCPSFVYVQCGVKSCRDLVQVAEIAEVGHSWGKVVWEGGLLGGEGGGGTGGFLHGINDAENMHDYLHTNTSKHFMMPARLIQL